MTASTIELSGIHVYPVKSLRGVRVDEVSVEGGRLTGDRNWILIDQTGQFMHQRDYPQMARVGTALTADGISVQAAGLPLLALRSPTSSHGNGEGLTHVRLWRRSAPVVHVSDEADHWFTDALGVQARLMAFVPGAPALDVPGYETHSSLQDATPFHLTTEESLADLNRRMDVPIPMNRFRPNLVVRGASPYAEDEWKRIAIGDSIFRWIKACTRCVTTMTDQETGARSLKEPLLALSKYRRQGSEVAFGHYLVADKWGDALRVGDRVTVFG